MTEFRITITRHLDRVRITVWKDAESNKQAKELAFKDRSVLEFLSCYDGLYNVKVINTEIIELNKLVVVTKPQLN